MKMTAEEYRKKTEPLKKTIYSFNRGGDLMEAFIPFNSPPENEGIYLTIRCGLNGIYTAIDQWKEGKWQLGVLDASKVIAYSVNSLNL